MVSFCKSCQQNNVNTRIEWRPNPDKPGKNKPFDIDKNEWHNCPYWKPDPNYKKKLEIPPDVKAEFDKIEREANQGNLTATDVADIKRTLIKIEEQTEAILTFLQNKMGWEKASEVKPATEIPKQDEFIAED